MADQHKKILVGFLFMLMVIASVFYFRDARPWIDKEFPGILVFENKVVGAFNQYEWNGPKNGLRYHDLLGTDIDLTPQIFGLADFITVFCLPFFSGLMYAILALVLFGIMRSFNGAIPFFLFNLGIGYYLIASFDFHTGHHLSWFFLLNFAFLPAWMSHFALVYPQKPDFISKKPFLILIPYAFAAVLYVPYVTSFYQHPLQWPFWEGLVVVYAALSYLAWIGRLFYVSRHPQNAAKRISATYLLFGQALAFVFPVIAALDIFLFKGNLPLNWLAPVTVIFPIAAIGGMLMVRLKQTQFNLIQSEKMASLGQMLSGVAHEINNPTNFIYANLAPLKEYVDYMKKNLPANSPKYKNEMTGTEVTDDLQKLVENIAEGAEKTRAIVADLRRFGHAQEGAQSNVLVLKNIESTLNILKHAWRDRIHIHIDCRPDLTIFVNAGQFSQVLLNLLGNAIQAIHDVGEIWIRVKESPQNITISIRDSGHGIPANLQHKIFDPFFTTKEQGEGTGLGLSIVRQFVKSWKGDIKVESAVGKGTEFTITIPNKTP